MIQDIAPHQFHNEYKAYEIQNGDYVLFYRQRDVLLRYVDEQIVYPKYEEVSDRESRSYIYLFSIDAQRYYFCDETDETLMEAYQFVNIQKMRKGQPKHQAFAGVTGLQLAEWYRSRRFCGRCGTGMTHSAKERMVQCPECGQMEYPKISPAVIIALVHGNRILMSKYVGRAYKNYALLAGFSEIGEPVEETVRREVMEEVGLQVTDLRYYGSQPWGFSDSVISGFFAKLDGSGAVRLDRDELSEAVWLSREEIPPQNTGISITAEMIEAFRTGKVKD